MKRLVTIAWMLMVFIPVASSGQSEVLDVLVEKISRIRTEVGKIDNKITGLAGRKMQLESKLEDLAREIQVRKTSGPQYGLIPDFTLQEMLRDSHQTSESLNSVLKQLDVLGNDRKTGQEKLSEVHQLVLKEIDKALQNATNDEKAVLFGLLNELREGKGMVDRPPDGDLHTPPPMKTSELLDANDPEELQERADALKDEQDRLRRGLVELERNIKVLRDRQRIDRQMRDFQKDQLLFAERSRVFQLTGMRDGATLDGESSGNDISPTPTDAEVKDLTHLDLFDPYKGTSYESIARFVVDSRINSVSVSERQDHIDGPKNQDKDTRPISALDEMRILTKARKGIIHQIKRLQILYDRVMEKAELLETE